jgi:hypothetical protein
MVVAAFVAAQEAPTGGPVEMSGKEKSALEALKGKVNGLVVWSTSRSNSKHDLWLMNADGSEQRQLTKGDNVDWFPRFSGDGKKIVFVRSKAGWVSEGDAEMNDKWDVWTINTDGTDEKKVADNACWGAFTAAGDSIVFARAAKVFIKDLVGGKESELVDVEQTTKKNTYAQHPQLSPNGKWLAITLRGTTRETGIWDLQKKAWYSTGGGCEITWFPDNKRVLRVNEGQGNGGTEILAIDIGADGKPLQKTTGITVPKEVRFMDLVGRRSHEYFPRIDQQTGKWMVWGASMGPHEHDLVDYEIFIWNIDTDKKTGPVRLTFHDGNDRWPDIFVTK